MCAGSMARTAMTMSTGGRIAEHLSVGVLARTHPRERIRDILERMGLQSKRVRDLPAEALVYYVIALGLFMAVSTGEVLRCLVEGLQWLGGRIGQGQGGDFPGAQPAGRSAPEGALAGEQHCDGRGGTAGELLPRMKTGLH